MVACTNLVNAQIVDSTSPIPTPQRLIPNDSLRSSKVSIGLQAGSLGAGVNVSYKINTNIALTLQTGFLPNALFTVKKEINLANTPFHTLVTGNMTNSALLLKAYLFRKSSLKIVTGLSYFSQANVDIVAYPVHQQKYGDIPLSTEMAGIFKSTFEVKGMAPYVGISLGDKRRPRHALGISLDFGVFYLPEPVASLTGTGTFADMYKNDNTFNNSIKSYTFYPLSQATIKYQFKSHTRVKK